MPRPNYSAKTIDTLASLRVGQRVDRPAALLTSAADIPLFTVAGGDILLTTFYGEIMVVLDDTTLLTLTYNPDAGVATVLGSVCADCDTFVAGRMVYLPAALGVFVFTATCGACPVDIGPQYILPPGHFDLTSTGDTVAGTIRWSMWYVPLDDGVTVVAN